MTAILQLHPISGPRDLCSLSVPPSEKELANMHQSQTRKNTASFNQYAPSKDRASSVISQNTLFCCSTQERESSIMSLSSSPSSSSNTSTPTTMRVHNLKHHYSQLGKVSKALSSSSSSSSSSHQSSATSRMTGWEYEWQICKRADAAHQSHDFFTSVNNMHLNRYTDILASTFFFAFVFAFVGSQCIYLLWL